MSYYNNQKKPSSLDELKKRIKENTLGGVYLFWGEEEYTKDFYAEKLRKTAKSSPLPEFNYVIFDAETQSVGEFEEATFALPYLWDNKVIEIRNLLPNKVSADDGEYYARIFETLPEYLTVLILLRAGEYGGAKTNNDSKKAETEKKNGFKTLLKSVEENGLAVEFEPERGEKLNNWVAKHFAARGVKIAPNLPSFLVSYCGTDMYTLQGEIGKLCDAYEGKPLTDRDAVKYCCANESYVFFDVAACMNRHDLVGAKRILSGLRLTPETVPMAMGYLAANYQLMVLVKAAMDSGKTASQIAAEHKSIPAWKISKALNSLCNSDASFLNETVAEIAAADTKLKNMRGNPAAILELLIYKICMYGK
ncbi:MAG: DNA polymerase III subunit delta [Clostridia bacterium]|nr:DNA polymerase III subunit delta [Clostridia bacterium]